MKNLEQRARSLALGSVLGASVLMSGCAGPGGGEGVASRTGTLQHQQPDPSSSRIVPVYILRDSPNESAAGVLNLASMFLGGAGFSAALRGHQMTGYLLNVGSEGLGRSAMIEGMKDAGRNVGEGLENQAVQPSFPGKIHYRTLQFNHVLFYTSTPYLDLDGDPNGLMYGELHPVIQGTFPHPTDTIVVGCAAENDVYRGTIKLIEKSGKLNEEFSFDQPSMNIALSARNLPPGTYFAAFYGHRRTARRGYDFNHFIGLIPFEVKPSDREQQPNAQSDVQPEIKKLMYNLLPRERPRIFFDALRPRKFY